MNKAKQVPFDFPVAAGYDPQDYIITHCNEEAAGWVARWPNWTSHSPALVVYGPKAAGKRHLANIWAGRAGADVVTAAEFMAQPASAWIEKARNLAVLHADFLIGDRAAEEQLFHVYNAALNDKRFILLTMNDAPSRLEHDFVLPDLKSRLVGTPSTPIHHPDEEMMAQIMIKLLRDRQMDVDPKIITYALHRMERSFEAAVQLALALDTLSLAEKKAVQLSHVRAALMEFEG